MECARALLLLHCFHGVRRQMRRLASTASQACRFLNLPTTFNIPAKASNDGIPAFVALDRGAASPPEFRGALARLNASPPGPAISPVPSRLRRLQLCCDLAAFSKRRCMNHDTSASAHARSVGAGLVVRLVCVLSVVCVLWCASGMRRMGGLLFVSAVVLYCSR